VKRDFIQVFLIGKKSQRFNMVDQREGGPRKQEGRTVAAASRGQKK
jgi:hypothetical protein